MAKLSEMGVSLVETKEAELEEEVATREEPEEEAEGKNELVEVQATVGPGQVRGQGACRAHQRPRAISPSRERSSTELISRRYMPSSPSASRPAAEP